ncbi:MAG: hypothetical protein KAY65_00865, partial [Planctomycetes bacterium]|nr:hypothetical protein [Planctomycetota bacterium]
IPPERLPFDLVRGHQVGVLGGTGFQPVKTRPGWPCHKWFDKTSLRVIITFFLESSGIGLVWVFDCFGAQQLLFLKRDNDRTIEEHFGTE